MAACREFEGVPGCAVAATVVAEEGFNGVVFLFLIGILELVLDFTPWVAVTVVVAVR